MSPISHFLPILVLFFFLDHPIHTFAGNFPTSRSPINSFANYDHGHSGMHLASQDSTHSTPKLRKIAFGRVNTIATGVIIAITILNIIVYWLRQILEANLHEKYTPSEQLCRRFLLADIQLATNHFDDSLVLGQGGFGKVYKGEIDDGTITVAIKRLNPTSKQGAPEFRAEIEMLSRIRHINIVSLVGYCDDCDEMILVYEYMNHGTLANNMHRNGNKSDLPWEQRVKICIGAARGLDYLHTGTGDRKRIIHRDVKSSNILLGENWTAKISDFGLSKIGPANQLHTHVSTRVKGTDGYVDPEYAMNRRLTRKSDVYSFGVVLFEVLGGRKAVDPSLGFMQKDLVVWALHCIEEGKLDQIVDPSLRGQILSDSLKAFAQIAGQCLQMVSRERPTMAEVVVELERSLTLQEKELLIFGEAFFNTGGSCNNQENADSSIKELAVINGGCDNQENADSSIKEQVINATNDLRHVEQIEGIMQLDGASNEESPVTPARPMGYTVIMRQFLGTGRVISAQSDGKLSKNNKSNNNSGGNIMMSSEDGDVQQVPSVGQIETPNLKIFTLAELKTATRNFRLDMEIDDGEGRFGMVYKGWVDVNTYRSSTVGIGMTIAVRKINLTCREHKDVMSVVESWGKFSHPNLVKILGYCFEDGEFFLVHEYMQWGSLERHLFRSSNTFKTLHSDLKNFQTPLPWVTRLKIATEAARGLAFLHTSENEAIYNQHKTFKILLDADFNSKLLDFELVEWSTVQLRLKSDVYGFGVVLLEILTGQRAVDLNRPFERQYLVEWSRPFLINKRTLNRVMDPHLEGQYSQKCAFEYAGLVGKCVDSNPKSRPSMEEVLKTLEHIHASEMQPDPSQQK